MEHQLQTGKHRFLVIKLLAMVVAFAAPVAATAADASDKNHIPEEGRQLIGSVGVDRVIERNNESDTWKLLEEGFVIECSARFESGCQLFLKK